MANASINIIAIFMMLALMTASGCQTTKVSSAGGVVPLKEEFSISVPSSLSIKQGANTTMTIALNRGADFKRDVQLTVKTDGISITPASVLVQASDKPDVQFLINVAREAAIGDYRVTVTGRPESGEPTATTFIIKVVGQ